MRIAKRAAVVLVMTPLMAIAQRSGGRTERKPSPATSATAAPSGAQSAPNSQPAANPYRTNPGSSAPIAPPPVAPRPIASAPLTRPFAALPVPALAPQPAPTSIATSVPVPVPQPLVSAVPSPEPVAAVNYAQGQLTVVAQSASLGTVLKLISAKTGAAIDLAPELQNEPVVAQIGPSAVRDVMTALLDSPKIDYIIMGSGNASGGIERILVRTRQSFGRTAIAESRPAAPAPAEETGFRFNTNGSPAASVAKPQTPLTQEQLMANWTKVREEKRLAEIEQQRQERENEANGVAPPPQPEPQTQPEPQPNNADSPPLKQ